MLLVQHTISSETVRASISLLVVGTSNQQAGVRVFFVSSTRKEHEFNQGTDQLQLCSDRGKIMSKKSGAIYLPPVHAAAQKEYIDQRAVSTCSLT